jgi:hypothetical protein
MTTPGNATTIRTQSGGMRTEYVLVQGKDTQKRSSYQPATSVPSGIPAFLGNREVIFGSWAVAMALVSWDEWKNNGILPRPYRLWDTTLLYGGLCLLSIVDALVPIANALAIGYTIALMYEFFTGGGDFGGEGEAEAAG